MYCHPKDWDQYACQNDVKYAWLTGQGRQPPRNLAAALDSCTLSRDSLVCRLIIDVSLGWRDVGWCVRCGNWGWVTGLGIVLKQMMVSSCIRQWERHSIDLRYMSNFANVVWFVLELRVRREGGMTNAKTRGSQLNYYSARYTLSF